MKKLIVIAIAGVVGLGLSSPAQAEPIEDAYPEIPDYCILELGGPSRTPHSPAGTEVSEDTPLCSELNICFVKVMVPVDEPGPARQPHGETILPEECTDVAPECVLELMPAGPSRGIHGLPAVPVDPTPDTSSTPDPLITPDPTPTVVSGPSIYIVQDCQEQLSLALAPVPAPVVGSNNTPTILMASALVLTGGLLIIGQRRLARR